MTLEDISKQIKSIRRDAEQSLGCPLTAKFWDSIDDDIGNTAKDYAGDPEGAQEYISEYMEVTQRSIEVIKIVTPDLKKQFEKESGIKPSRSASKYSTPPKAKAMRRGLFERRLHLFDFIMQSKGSIAARPNWKQIADKWNKEHPYYPQTALNLKKRFWEMQRDDMLTQSWLAWRVYPVVYEALRQGLQNFKQGIQNLKQRPEAIQRAQERIMQMIADHPEARTLNDLVEIEESQITEKQMTNLSLQA